MKKLICFAIAAIAAMSFSILAFAEAPGVINADEQRVLDLLDSTVTVQGKEVGLHPENITAAENYFKTIDLSTAAADAVIENANKAIEKYKAMNILKFENWPVNDYKEFLQYGSDAASAGGIMIVWRADTKTFDFVDMVTCEVIYTQKEIIKYTGSVNFVPFVIAGAVLLASVSGYVFFKKRGTVEK